MLKAKILSIEGKEKGEIELPKYFSEKIREDISQRFFEVEKRIQPYASYFLAGRASAIGKPKHVRHKWKTLYGHGMSRVPRKIFWRRGTQFYWKAAEIASAVGGRRAHPPRISQFLKINKINSKEKKIALFSAIASTASPVYLKKRYSRIEDEIKGLPFVVESKLLELKVKKAIESLKIILGKNYELAFKDKKKAGLLLIIGKNEQFKFKGITIRKVNEIRISDLFPLGRLAIYTENAIKELKEMAK